MSHIGNNRKARKAGASFLLFVLGVSTALSMTFGTPAPAYAIPVEVTADAPFTTYFVRDEVNLGLAESAAVAVVGAANYFLSQIAYSAAVALTSDCPGQVVCWNTKAFEDGFEQAWQGAIGEAVGQLSEALGLGDLLCSPEGLNFALQLALIDELKPNPPKCEFNALKNNWETAINSLSNAELSDVIKVQFQPGQSELSAGLIMYDHINNEVKRDAEIHAIVGQLADAANGGFSAITDVVTGRVTAPQDTVRAQFQTNTLVEEKKLDNSNAVTAGQIAKGAVVGVVLNTTQVFVQTLASRLLNKLANGLISGDEAREAQPDLILSADGILLPPGRSGAERVAARRNSATLLPREINDIDPLLDFTTCPARNPSQYNCVMDTQFANAVRAAAFEPLTIEDALEQGFLHGDWPLVSALHDPAAANDRNCYARGYCEPNLKILRAFRIIPVGWEIAAADAVGDAAHPPTLQQVVDGFNDCNATGGRDLQHKFCKLINPDWVLKIPPTQCLQEGYSATLIDSSLPNRATQCTDFVQCLGEDGNGQCEDGYGYCLFEKNIWRFKGDECPAYYNSCTTVTPKSGATRSYLTNTIAPGICTADNAGCKQYSLQQNLSQDSANKADDWTLGSYSLTDRYFTRKAETCSPSDDGCTALRMLSPEQSLNLVRNGGFDELVDRTLDGTAESPDFWQQPNGFIPSGSTGFVSTDGTESASGIAAVYLADQNQVYSTCALSGTAVCTDPNGCSCATGSRTCAVPMNLRTCNIVNAVSQGGIPVFPGRTYTLSARFAPEATGDYEANIRLRFFDEKGGWIPVSSSSFVTSTTSDNAAAAASVLCRAVSASTLYGVSAPHSYLELFLDGRSSGGEVTPSCTFSVSDVAAWAGKGMPAFATIDILSTDGNGVWVDDVMLEEGFGTTFHEEYNGAGPIEYAKVPPSYLGCTGDASDRPECANYAQVCRETEVGCSAYTPVNGDPMVPGIVSAEDYCPAECVGYDTFKQERSNFDVEKFPTYFIPSTAQQCTAADAGCTEFTNLNDESRAFFTQIRVCQLPGSSDTDTYYTWEGSETAGYQLQVWNLKHSNIVATHDADGSDISATNGGAAGRAPCTKLAVDSTNTCSNAPSDGADEGLCTAADIAGGSFDCREFYDAEANRHYRLLSKTIQESAACEDYRITAVSEADCELSNGRWSPATRECIYAIDPGLSRSCSAAAKDCRAYSGNAAGNVQTLFSDDFESGFNFAGFDEGDGWANRSLSSANLTHSSEALSVGGHSLKVAPNGSSGSRRRVALRDVTEDLELGRSYMVKFWARGTGAIEVRFDGIDGGAQPTVKQFAYAADDAATPGAEPVVRLDTAWREYSLGPVIFEPPASYTFPQRVALRIGDAGNVPNETPDFFLDNVRFEMVQDSIYVIRDSWVTPISCDRTPTGIPSPREMLGCRAYDTAENSAVTLRSFTQLCRETAIGCKAYADLQNTPTEPYAHSYNNLCSLDNPSTDSIERCSPVSGAVGCPCHLDLAPMLTSIGYLPNVCVVAPGATSCRFETDMSLAVGTFGSSTITVGIGATTEATCRLASNCASAAGCPCSDPEFGSCTVPQNRDWCSAKNDTVIVNADERRFLVVEEGDRCNSTAASCVATGLATASIEGTCRFTNPGPTSSLVDDFNYSCGASVCIRGANRGSVCTDNNDCDGTSGSCAASPNAPSNGQCECNAVATGGGALGTCFVKEGDDSCVYQHVSGAQVSEWTAGAIKDDPSKYSTTLCTSEAISCEEWKTSDRTLYFKDPGGNVCEYKVSIDYQIPGSLTTVKRSGWFRVTSDGSLFPCAPELVKNGNEFGIYRNDDVSCTLGTTCTAAAGCTCMDDVTGRSCRVAQDQRSCGFQEWTGACQPKFSSCTEFVDPYDTSNNNAEGTPYYFLDNAKLDRGSCTGGASLENGCIVFDQTSNVTKSMNSRATYALSQRKFEGANVAPVNCEENPGHEFCRQLCTWVDSGHCSVNLQPCSMHSQCPSGQTCQGDRVIGDSCRNAVDCGGFECLSAQAIITQYGADMSSSEESAARAALETNDGNVVLKVTRDRECATWLEKSQCSSVKDPNTGEFVQQCSGLDLCSEHEPTSSGFQCTSTPKKSQAFPFVDWWYTLRDVSWNGVEVSGYSTMGRVFPDIIDPVNVAPGWCRDADGQDIAPTWSCYADADCSGFGTAATCSGPREGICSKLLNNQWQLGCDANIDCGADDGSGAYGFCDTSDTKRIRVGVQKPLPPGQTCSNHAQCGDALCVHGSCWWNVNGFALDVRAEVNAIQCREYPEVDAPFKDTILSSAREDWLTPASKKEGYGAANVCLPGHACQCAYNRLDYGSAAQALFVSATSNLSAPPELLAICVGGTIAGIPCTTPDQCGEGGTCTLVSNVTHAIGKQGFCFDPDYSYSINGNPNEYGCNLWLPIDHIAGTADVFNQHPEAGWQSPGGRQNLLYCTEAEGNARGGSYEPILLTDSNPVCRSQPDFLGDPTALVNFMTQCSLDRTIWPVPPFSTENSDGAALSAEKHFNNTRDVSTFNIRREDLVSVAVRLYENQNDDGVYSTFWLHNGNSFTAGIGISNDDRGANVSEGGNGAQMYNAPANHCNFSNGEDYCESNDGKCIAVRANFNPSGVLSSIQTVTCVGDTEGETQFLAPASFVQAYLREECTEFLHAYADGSTKVATDAMWRYENSIGGQWLAGNTNYLFSHDTHQSVAPEPTLVPFGHLSYTGAISTTAMINGLSSKIVVAGEDYGSAYTTASTSTSTNVSGQPTFSPTSAGGGMVVAGYPFACAGPCLSILSNSSTGAGAPAAGRAIFQNLFVTTVGSYRWDIASSRYVRASNPLVISADSADPRWDRRQAMTGDQQKLRAIALDPDRCTTESCNEVNFDGITVNDEYLPGSLVCGDGGVLAARIRYYAFADPNHMPIKRKVFDFGFGAGTARAPDKSGDYKNHRGTSPIDGSSLCNESTWGQTDDACDPSWFEEEVNYSCTRGYRDGDSDNSPLPECGNGSYPCRDADQGGDFCMFKPRVQFLDNWGVCNGTCPGAPGNGTVCINARRTDDDVYEEECSVAALRDPNNYNALDKPWTEFRGDIKVYTSDAPNGCGTP